MTELIHNPYEGIDWDTVQQRRAWLHGHSDRSHGSEGSGFSTELPQDAIRILVEDFGIEVLALTDTHRFATGTTWPWDDISHLDGPNSEKYEDVHIENLAGDVIPIQGMEQQEASETQIDHLITLFTDFDANQHGNVESEQDIIDYLPTHDSDAVMWFAHPGRYYGDPDDAVSDYINMMEGNGHVLGLEVFNQGGRHKEMDGLLWDLLSGHFGPDRQVYAFGVDDIHNWDEGDDLDVSSTTLLLDSFSEQDAYDAITTGRFFANNHEAVGAEPPSIDKIEADGEEQTITVTASDYESIEWISHGGTVVQTGPTLDYSRPSVHTFARARVIGNPSETTTQTFALTETDYNWSLASESDWSSTSDGKWSLRPN